MKHDYYDFYNIAREDGAFVAREWDYWTAIEMAKEEGAKTGLWHEVHGVKVLERIHREKATP